MALQSNSDDRPITRMDASELKLAIIAALIGNESLSLKELGEIGQTVLHRDVMLKEDAVVKETRTFYFQVRKHLEFTLG